MRKLSVSEVSDKFGQLLDHVEHGQEILITRRGRAVARLVPAQPGFDREKARRAVVGILELSKGVTLRGAQHHGSDQ